MCGNLDTALEQIRKIKLECAIPDEEYWESLDRPGCTKWQFYRHHVHMADAYVRMGHYQTYLRELKKWEVLPLISIEVNPNKHHDKNWFKMLMAFVREWCASGFLKRYDYAVDIPMSLDSVQVFQSRKERGLHKGTRYYGQRNKHGYCKIYDKQKEQGLESCLTRVEHTLRADTVVSLEKVMILDPKSIRIENENELNGTDKGIVESIRRMRTNGIECDDILQMFGRRKMEKLEKHITGNYVPLEYGDYLTYLLGEIRKLFNLVDIIPDKDGFLQVDDLEDIL